MDSAFHEFRVDYEQAKHLAIGAAVHSDAFSAGGHMWRLNLYPRGISQSDNGLYVSLYFELLERSMTRTVDAMCEAFFIDRNGKTSSTTPMRSNVHQFQMSGGGAWGWSRFLHVAVLEGSYVTDGNIQLVCAIIVLNDSSIPVPPSDLTEHLGRLLDNGDGTDVSFIVGGQTFHGHRALLAARSPVFEAALHGSMAEATMSAITVQGIAPEIFRFMLQFLYTETLPTDDELGDFATRFKTFVQLLAAADRYALDRLKLLCAKKLWDNMTLDLVARTFSFADTYNCPELKTKCLDFMIASSPRVFVTQGYFDLGARHPHLIAELRQKVGHGHITIQ